MNTIVVGTDGSERAEAAIHEGAALAKARGARLLLVTAYADHLGYRRRIAGKTGAVIKVDGSDTAEEILSHAAALAQDDGVEAGTQARAGDPAEVLMDVATEQDAELIVVGDKGMTGAQRFLLGSVPDKISHHAPCNLLIVHGNGR